MGEIVESRVFESAEMLFRRRLAHKLAERGYSGEALAAKVEELLRLDIPLRFPPDLMNDMPPA